LEEINRLITAAWRNTKRFRICLVDYVFATEASDLGLEEPIDSLCSLSIWESPKHPPPGVAIHLQSFVLSKLYTNDGGGSEHLN
jgi:hypothetical protein